ncbi:MAG TPA: hypothetical protein VJ201_05190 [Candidatus Babeliales bacterium]|nr:hypothetical protein [Candidatus Babeliales bacterium]
MKKRNLQKCILYFFILIYSFESGISGVAFAIPVAVPAVKVVADTVLLLAAIMLASQYKTDESLVLQDISKIAKEIEKSQAQQANSSQAQTQVNDQAHEKLIAKTIAALEEGKIRCTAGSASQVVVTISPELTHSWAQTYTVREIPGGFRVETQSGVYAQVSMAPRQSTLADQISEQWKRETFDTLIRMQIDPEFSREVRRCLSVFIERVMQTNSHILAERIQARIDIANLDQLYLPEPYRSHANKLRKVMLKHYFHKDGSLRFIEQDTCMKSRIKHFFKQIQMRDSAPYYNDQRLETTQEAHDHGRFKQWKHELAVLGSSKLKKRVLQDKTNGKLLQFIDLCQHYDFEAAKIAQKKLGSYGSAMQEILSYYQQEYKQKVFDERGIYRACLADPILKKLTKNDWLEIQKDVHKRDELNTQLLIRKNIKESMCQQWGISEQASSVVHQALYEILGEDGQGLSNADQLLERAVEISKTYQGLEYEQITQALFLSHGVFKDIAHFQEAQNLSFPKKILNKEYWFTRLQLNKLLKIAHGHQDTKRAKIACDGIAYLQKSMSVSDRKEMVIYKKLANEAYRSAVEQKKSIIDSLPLLIQDYSSPAQQKAHNQLLACVDTLLSVSQNLEQESKEYRSACTTLAQELSVIHELNKIGNVESARHMLSWVFGLNQEQLDDLDIGVLLEKVSAAITRDIQEEDSDSEDASERQDEEVSASENEQGVGPDFMPDGPENDDDDKFCETEDVLKDATQEDSKLRTKQYGKEGGYKDAMRDFDALQPDKVQVSKNGTKIGKLRDGRTVNVRPKSREGRPTLEIYNPKNQTHIKIRYGVRVK